MIKMNIKITSPAFKDRGMIPSKYTCDGDNTSPPLNIEIDKGAETLVLIVDDPDAPMGVWDHWIVWNISPDVKNIEEDSVPQNSIQGTNSSGKSSYGGPCPPSGTHRYRFKLYALDKKLDLSSSARKSDVEREMKGHILAQAEMVGLYSRK
jgi:hypothetical protein